ncbi:MAG: ATP-binding cassette domain-containing protein [Planctomycetaceae bacterium]|nr:ATP-binding cassette domain-containing protein [Planctomycetaceae bacterium]
MSSVQNTSSYFYTEKPAVPQVRQNGLAISLRNVSYAVRDKKLNPFNSGKKTLLHNINLDVRPGEFVGIIGPSGSGKSTLIKILCGVNTAASGNVAYDGLSSNNYPMHKISYLPQNVILHESLKVKSALKYSAILRSISQKEVPDKIKEVNDRAGLTDSNADTVIKNLSGGQKKRVALAAELLSNPSALFLDEVTSGLDPCSEEEMMREFKKQAERGITTVCITHNPENLKLCDRLLVINQGVLVFNGTPPEAVRYFMKLNSTIRSITDIYKFLQTGSAQKISTLEAYPFSASRTAKRPIGIDRSNNVPPLPMLEQLKVLLVRYLFTFLFENPLVTSFLIVLAPIIALLIGIAFGDIAGDNDITHAINWQKISFSLLFTAFLCSSLIAALQIVQERHIYQHERRYRLNSAAYLFSKFILLGIIGIIQACIVLAVVMPMTNLGPDADMFTWVTISLVALSGTAFGLAVSSLANDRTVGIIILLIILVVQLVFSGGLIPVTDNLKIAAMLSAPPFWGLDSMKAALSSELLDAALPGQSPILGNPDYSILENLFAIAVQILAALGAARLFLLIPSDNAAVPVVQETNAVFGKVIGGVVKTAVVVLIPLAVVGIGLPIYSESQKLDDRVKKLVKKEIAEQPLEITGISVDWTDKPNAGEMVKLFWGDAWRRITGFKDDVSRSRSVSGTFTANIKTTEKFYQAVSIRDGLRELEITDSSGDEFDKAKEKYRRLPKAYQDDLRKFEPDDLSSFQFYKPVKIEETTLSGTVKLGKKGSANRQADDDIHINTSSIDDFIPESKLPRNANKLDVPSTEQAVEAVIQDKKNFADKVEEAITDMQKCGEVAKTAIKEGLPKELPSHPPLISFNWTTQTSSSASATFSAAIKTTEKLYQSVDTETGMRKLGIADSYEQEFEIAKNTIRNLPKPYRTKLEEECDEVTNLSKFQFYDAQIQKDEELPLTGYIELTKTADKGWRADKIQQNDMNLVAEPKLKEDAYKLDDPKTKEAVAAIVSNKKDIVDRLKSVSVFYKYCKPNEKYEGSFEAFGAKAEVGVVFQKFEPNKDITVSGTITFTSHGVGVDRLFSVGINTGKDSKVTGEINNKEIPTEEKFIAVLEREFGPIGNKAPARNFYSTIARYSIINVEFTDDKMTFFVDRPPGGEPPLQRGPNRLEIKFPIER